MPFHITLSIAPSALLYYSPNPHSPFGFINGTSLRQQSVVCRQLFVELLLNLFFSQRLLTLPLLVQRVVPFRALPVRGLSCHHHSLVYYTFYCYGFYSFFLHRLALRATTITTASSSTNHYDYDYYIMLVFFFFFIVTVAVTVAVRPTLLDKL